MSKKLFYYGSTTSFIDSLCFNFDGINENLAITDNALLDPAGDFSYSLWMKRLGNPDLFDGIIDKYIGGASGYYITSLATRAVRAGVKTGSGDYTATSTSTPANNTWFHIAFTFDTNLKMYINGVLEATTPVAGTVTANNHALYFNGDGVSTLYSHIRLDLIKYWSKALTLAEVQEDMVTNDPRTSSMAANIVCFWALGEAPGDDATGGTGIIHDMINAQNATTFNTEAADLFADVPP